MKFITVIKNELGVVVAILDICNYLEQLEIEEILSQHQEYWLSCEVVNEE